MEHCCCTGTGSIFETLQLGKPLIVIVVVNEDLMDNHQSELAERERNHASSIYALALKCMLYQIIADMNLDCLLPYPPTNATLVAKLINSFLARFS